MCARFLISCVQSIFLHAGNKWIWMLWGEKAESARSWTQDASGLSRQWSATGPWQLDDHQPSHIEDCEGCWSSSCRGLVAEHWWLKPDTSWVQFLVAASLFTFHYFRLIKFIYWFSVYLFKKIKVGDQWLSEMWIENSVAMVIYSIFVATLWACVYICSVYQ